MLVIVVVVVVCAEYSYGDYSDTRIYVSNDSRKNNYFNILNDDDNDDDDDNNCAFTFIF